MTDTQPDPIPHLITAVTELGSALRDLDASRPATLRRTPLAQDSEEYADEIHTLITLILRHLHETATK
ncbi:MAG: hypothetical protein ABS61_05570 [Microbacterium sp. SCN 70-18]|nr:hypothetical protein [Microbacterium chocolatum]ODT11050.1 MAG: hypothetical protein ABS61_05570 [Microbacterium sp. SCN 70-18]